METWARVEGFDYEVSDHGRLRRRGKILAPGRAGRYRQAQLYRDGRAHRRYVHQLVLEAFVGPRPAGLVACHGDGDADNNAATNLRWDTPAENNRDLVRHGRGRASASHCRNDHEYTVENTRWYRGIRYCRTCRRRSVGRG